jgi:hypothetical protein
MSYDLFFKSRNQNSKPEAKAFTSYFKQRKHYEVSGQQAIYKNETTGVYFIFDIGDVGDVEQPDLAPVSFNLNYFRPHVFGLEAEPEVSAFVKEFSLLVSDPQVSGMGDGEYRSESFLHGWNAGNEFGYRAMLKPEEKPPLTLSTAKIEACWRWNKAKDELQEKLGDDVFVPRFMYLNRNGKVATTVVWPDGIPIAIPEADTVLIQRKTILPKRLFRTSEDQVLATWNEIEALVRQFPLEQGPIPYRLLSYSAVPASVTSHLVRLRPMKEKLEGVGIDTILNLELVEKTQTK